MQAMAIIFRRRALYALLCVHVEFIQAWKHWMALPEGELPVHLAFWALRSYSAEKQRSLTFVQAAQDHTKKSRMWKVRFNIAISCQSSQILQAVWSFILLWKALFKYTVCRHAPASTFDSHPTQTHFSYCLKSLVTGTCREVFPSQH